MITKMSLRKCVQLVLLLGVMVWSMRMIYPAYNDYTKNREQLHEIEQQLLEQQKDNEALRIQNYKLKTDQKAVERVAREKFGWSRSGEKVYDFSN